MAEALGQEVVPGKVRRLFPGNNTAYGFYSFYDQIVKPGANHIFVIKGGPGVGKSTFMRAIGQELVNRGLDIEQHCCSSDPNSLDGIYIPALDIALIDGTSPHVVDPKNPGAVDEIVHLGDYWRRDGIQAHKDEILTVNREVGRLFRRAYSYLAAAKIFRDEVETCHRESGAIDDLAIARLAHELAGDLIGTGATSHKGNVRHLFITAITPIGPMSYLADVADGAKQRLIISGGPGTGGDELLRRLTDELSVAGLDLEVFHCPLDPKRIEHIYIPGQNTMIMTSADPHPLAPAAGDRLIDLPALLNRARLEKYETEIVEAACLYQDAFEVAIASISRAKTLHDEMETYYVPYMDFERINERRNEVLARILASARAQGLLT